MYTVYRLCVASDRVLSLVYAAIGIHLGTEVFFHVYPKERFNLP